MERVLDQDAVFYYANPDFIAREIAGENVLVPTGKAAEKLYGIVSVNDTGRFLWDALQKKCTFTDLVNVLDASYDVDPQQSLKDVKEFLEIALSRNIVLCISKTPD